MRRAILVCLTTLSFAMLSLAQTASQSQTPAPQSVAPAPNTSPQTQPCNCPCANQAGSPQQNSTPAQPGTYNSNDPSQNTGIGSNAPQNPTYSSPNNPTTSSPQTSAAPTSQQTQTPAPAQSNAPPSTVYEQNTAAPNTPQQPLGPENPSTQQSNTQASPTLGTRQPPPTHIPMARTVPVGAEVDATLDTPLSSKTSRTGDPFTATLTQALRNNNGEVLVPIGAKVRGQVGSAESGKTLPSIRGKGQLTLRFTDVVLADGISVPFTATLLGVHDATGSKQPANTSEEGQITGKNSGTRTAKDVGIGAGIGTVAGLIFGSALKGLAIGAIAGGGYVLANGGKDVELPVDTGLRLRLDQNLTLPAKMAPAATTTR